ALPIYAPAGVVVERLPAPGPPGVGAVDLAGEVPGQVHPAELAEPAVQVGPFLRQETGVLPVPLPVLDVQLAVRDVHVPADDGAATLVSELTQPGGHLVQERVLQVHRGRAGSAGVDVGAHHGQRRARHVQVSLDPAADLVLGAARLGSDAAAPALQW